jgi:hypothetical protein
MPPQPRYQQMPNQQRPDQWRLTSGQQEPAPREPERVIECSYCRLINKSADQYSTHVVREPDGKTNCPELQQSICPLCGATGEKAHSEYFCPKSRFCQCYIDY